MRRRNWVKGKMNAVVRCLEFLLGISVFFSSGVLVGNAGAGREEVPYFTDRDMEKYKETSDSAHASPKPATPEAKGESSSERQMKREREAWCKKATLYRKAIEKDQEDIGKFEKERDELAGCKKGRKRKSLEKKLEKTKVHLGKAERDLAELDDEAHRKGVPPGWLRCQFE